MEIRTFSMEIQKETWVGVFFWTPCRHRNQFWFCAFLFLHAKAARLLQHVS